MSGKATLVGAGPGRADLITVRGLEAVRHAEVLIYDRLVAEELLAQTPANAERIFVGKQPGHYPKPQGEINRLIFEHVAAGKRVVRLKGGDPFIFGRGGEEAQMLAAAGLAYEIVPGVTSALAVPTYAGISVTHKGISSAFSIITGHEDPSKPRSQMEWQALAQIPTLVILMTVKNIAQVTQNLIGAGRHPDTPVAAISRGTIDEQQSLFGTLETLPDRIAAQKLPTPAIVVVGEVVNAAPELSWFQRSEAVGGFIPLMGGQVGRQSTQATPLTTMDKTKDSFANPVADGRTYLVGAGPGDPALITVRGQMALRQASVILHDRLVAPDLLALAPPHAKIINVGKGPERDRFPQAEINRLLVEEAQKASIADQSVMNQNVVNQTVVRLKGGDPFVLGFGIDECRALRQQKLPYEVIPGVSSITAAPAYAGIPVTHRGLSTMLTVLSGHAADEAQIGDVVWRHLPKAGTLVILMGAKKLPLIVRKLQEAGFEPDCAIALIQSGTTVAQSVVRSTLGKVLSSSEPPKPPTLIVVGNVARLHDTLAWFNPTETEAPQPTWGQARDPRSAMVGAS